jgi:hypothetical protein
LAIEKNRILCYFRAVLGLALVVLELEIGRIVGWSDKYSVRKWLLVMMFVVEGEASIGDHGYRDGTFLVIGYPGRTAWAIIAVFFVNKRSGGR